MAISVLNMSSTQFESDLKQINPEWKLSYNKLLDAFQVIQNNITVRTIYPEDLNCRTLINIRKDYYYSKNMGNIKYSNKIESENKNLQQKQQLNLKSEIKYQAKHHIPQFRAVNFLIGANPLSVN